MSDVSFTGNRETFQTRLNSRLCETCIFGQDCTVYTPEATEQLEQEAVEGNTFITCHMTYPPLGVAGFDAAVCRGYYNRNRRLGVFQWIRTLFGFEMVDPPSKK